MREETSNDDMDVDDANADDSDCEEVQLPEFDPDYETEDDEECDLPRETGQLYTGKNGTIWSTTPPHTGTIVTLLYGKHTGRLKNGTICNMWKTLQERSVLEKMLQKMNSMRIWVFYCLAASPIQVTSIRRICGKRDILHMML